MAFLQKKPQVSSSQPLFTLSASKTVLIVGLGNPGKQYAGTRHNIGFAALDHFASANDFPAWTDKKDLKCLLSLTMLGQNRVVLVKPSTFMNASGEAAIAVSQFYKIPSRQILAVYDELALDFGSLRIRHGGSDAGHNGVKSLIAHLGPDFGRLRIGVKNQQSLDEPAKFVLAKFSKAEQAQIEPVLKESAAFITEFIFSEQLQPETRSIL